MSNALMCSGKRTYVPRPVGRRLWMERTLGAETSSRNSHPVESLVEGLIRFPHAVHRNAYDPATDGVRLVDGLFGVF